MDGATVARLQALGEADGIGFDHEVDVVIRPVQQQITDAAADHVKRHTLFPRLPGNHVDQLGGAAAEHRRDLVGSDRFGGDRLGCRMRLCPILDQVGAGDDAEQRAVVAHHRDLPPPAGDHPLFEQRDRIVRAERDRARRHDLADGQIAQAVFDGAVGVAARQQADNLPVGDDREALVTDTAQLADDRPQFHVGVERLRAVRHQIGDAHGGLNRLVQLLPDRGDGFSQRRIVQSRCRCAGMPAAAEGSRNRSGVDGVVGGAADQMERSRHLHDQK